MQNQQVFYTYVCVKSVDYKLHPLFCRKEKRERVAKYISSLIVPNPSILQDFRNDNQHLLFQQRFIYYEVKFLALVNWQT